MPAFTHFDIYKNGSRPTPEQDLQLSDIDAAWEEATITCGQMIKEPRAAGRVQYFDPMTYVPFINIVSADP